MTAALSEAARAAGAAEAAVVVVGTTEHGESEGYDRTVLALGATQDALVRAVAAANPRTVAVVNSGGPVELPWREEAGAVLLAWFPGQEGGAGLADVLLGRAEPGGRLPTTWPAVLADAPVTRTRPDGGRLDYDEGLHLGYRGWLRHHRPPAYWFGHGLGYTTWTYEALTVPPLTRAGDDLTVRVRVRNTGSRAGREVVQVYLARPASALDRPARALGGYAAVRASPGETVTATVRVLGAGAVPLVGGGARLALGAGALPGAGREVGGGCAAGRGAGRWCPRPRREATESALPRAGPRPLGCGHEQTGPDPGGRRWWPTSRRAERTARWWCPRTPTIRCPRCSPVPGWRRCCSPVRACPVPLSHVDLAHRDAAGSPWSTCWSGGVAG
ncbi:hypothetical protein STENM327S_05196 [Streptomyces tendae]